MRIIKRNNCIIDIDKVTKTANELNLPPKLVELLFCRGLDSSEKISKFLYAGQNDFYDPFAFKDMQGVVDRIKQAEQNSEKVVVYSDYDADGICAAAILALFLASINIDVYTHIPSRSNEGYGLNFESLDYIIENTCPDLIITCDCGISSAKEIEHVLDLGVDIIVTDHHEVSDNIPNCLILNPHIVDCGYPFEYLCGAGVALKLVQAYLGFEKASEYLDMAAIATIADLVPLLDENRLIVQRGLKQIKNRTNKGIGVMLDRLGISDITSMDIAFKIAPRINAAGRMGDAFRAFSLLISNDTSEINTILDQIEKDNDMRKVLCEELYSEALGDLSFEQLYKKRSIVLSHPSWEKGITGIVAARLAGEFKRPSFILVKSGDVYKGTARSIEGINIYELLTYISDLLVEYGGHSQAAGFSITYENIEEFKHRVEEYLKRFDQDLFLPAYYYDIELSEQEMTNEFLQALDLLEPFGNSNCRPLIRLSTKVSRVTPCKSNFVHSQVVTSGKLNLIAFNFYNKNQILLGDNFKDLIIEAQFGLYNGVRGILRHAYSEKLYINDELAKANYIRTLNIPCTESYDEIKYSVGDLPSIIDDNIYGNLVIAGSKASFNRFMSLPISQKIILKEFVYSTDKNNYNRINISPNFDENLPLSLYKKVIFLDSPLTNKLIGFIQKTSKAEIYTPKTDNSKDFFDGIDLSRQTFAKYYEAIRSFSGSGSSIFSYFFNLNKLYPLKLNQFMVCILVFKELGFIQEKFTKGYTIVINNGVRASLESSKIYQYLDKKINEDSTQRLNAV